MSATILWTVKGPTPMGIGALFFPQLGSIAAIVKIWMDFREKILGDTFWDPLQMAIEKYNWYASMKRQQNYLKLHVGYIWVKNRDGNFKISKLSMHL